MDKLDTLAMNHNLLTRLEAGEFEGLPRLTSLSLDYNKITYIDREAFRGLEGRTEDTQWVLMIDNDECDLVRQPPVPLHHSQQAKLHPLPRSVAAAPDHHTSP